MRRLRLAHELTQEELGHRAGLDRTYISSVERAMRNPTVTVLDKIATGLGVSLTDLVA